MTDRLVIAAIAAGAALLGAAIGQLGPLVQHWLAARTARRNLLRDRYERMAQLAAGLSVQLLQKVDSVRAKSPGAPTHDAFRASTEMYTLALLYFPELAEPMRTLHRAISDALQALDTAQGHKASLASTAFAQARSNANASIQRYASKYT